MVDDAVMKGCQVLRRRSADSLELDYLIRDAALIRHQAANDEPPGLAAQPPPTTTARDTLLDLRAANS